MQFLITHILTALTLFFISSVMIRESRTEIKDKSGDIIVKMPKVLFVVGLLDTLVCLLLLILMYCFPNSTARPWVYCIITAFFVLGCYLMYLTVSWKITYSTESDYFIYRSALMRSGKYFYRDCYCNFEIGEIIIINIANSCKIRIPKEAIGFDHFAQTARQKCQVRTTKTL